MNKHLDKSPYPTLNQFIDDSSQITIVAGGQYEIRIKPSGNVIHNFEDGVWKQIYGDHFIDIEWGSLSGEPLTIRIRDKNNFHKTLFKLTNPTIIGVKNNQ